MNLINDLIEMGFITPSIGKTIMLHPMIQEIALVDMKPTISNCKTLCQSIKDVCLLHGIDVPYYKVMFQTVENIVKLIKKDNLHFYLLFLEDVFPYMEKYHYKQGMNLIINEMSNILEHQFSESNNDKALLLDYKAALEPKPEKAIQLEKAAISLLSDITSDNAHLAANLYANLGGLYHITQKNHLAYESMKIEISLLKEYNLLYTNDCIPQICNYASLLTDMGKIEDALNILNEIEQIVKETHSEISSITHP